MKRGTGTLYEDQPCTLMTVFPSFHPIIRKGLNKYCRRNQDTFCVQNFFPQIRAVYEKMWRNTVQAGRPRMAIQYGVCAVHAG